MFLQGSMQRRFDRVKRVSLPTPVIELFNRWYHTILLAYFSMTTLK